MVLVRRVPHLVEGPLLLSLRTLNLTCKYKVLLRRAPHWEEGFLVPGHRALNLEGRDKLPLVRGALHLEGGLPLLGQRTLRWEGDRLFDRRVLRLEGDQQQVFLGKADPRAADCGTRAVRSPAAPDPRVLVLAAAHQRALLGAQGTLPTASVRNAPKG